MIVWSGATFILRWSCLISLDCFLEILYHVHYNLKTTKPTVENKHIVRHNLPICDRCIFHGFLEDIKIETGTGRELFLLQSVLNVSNRRSHFKWISWSLVQTNRFSNRVASSLHLDKVLLEKLETCSIYRCGQKQH